MCVLLVLALMAMVWVYANYQIEDVRLVEQMGERTVEIASGWEILQIIWPVGLLFMLIGMFLLLVFLKIKKVI